MTILRNSFCCRPSKTKINNHCSQPQQNVADGRDLCVGVDLFKHHLDDLIGTDVLTDGAQDFKHITSDTMIADLHCNRLKSDRKYILETSEDQF